jgi:hypothetical protein
VFRQVVCWLLYRDKRKLSVLCVLVPLSTVAGGPLVIEFTKMVVELEEY